MARAKSDIRSRPSTIRLMAQAWTRAIWVLRACSRSMNRWLQVTTSWGGSTIPWVIERSARMAEQTMKHIVETLIDALGAGSVRFGDAIEPRYLGDWSGRSQIGRAHV